MRRKITIRQRRWLLSAHLLCTVAWLGAGLCSLIFNLSALFTPDSHLLAAAYVFADILDKAILRGGTVGALITGVLLSVLTQWGLFRFYWVIVKEIASLLCLITGVIISGWNDEAISLTVRWELQALHQPLYLTDRTWMFLGIFFQLVSLSGIIIISVFKPWGQRKRPYRSRQERLIHGQTHSSSRIAQ